MLTKQLSSAVLGALKSNLIDLGYCPEHFGATSYPVLSPDILRHIGPINMLKVYWPRLLLVHCRIILVHAGNDWDGVATRKWLPRSCTINLMNGEAKILRTEGWTRINPEWNSNFSWMMSMLISMFIFFKLCYCISYCQQWITVIHDIVHVHFNVEQWISTIMRGTSTHTYSRHTTPISVQIFLGRILLSHYWDGQTVLQSRVHQSWLHH